MRENLNFSNTLIMWYLINQRDLPWRKSKNPYLIWLSEIILQQTRIVQGTSYYEKFASEFEDIFALANADEKQILKLWQGLGYYSRARNLHATAKVLATEYDGEFPRTYKELISLKGIGDYTASAISSIAFDQPHAVVDGNVYRVLSRIFGIETPINESQGIKEFKSLAQTLLNKEDPGTHNQAIMEFGALVCTPKKPKCETCIFNNSCYALQKKTIDTLPVKIKKLKVKKRFFNYLVIDNNRGSTLVRQRTGKGIWQNLYEFPLYETDQLVENDSEIDEIVKNELFMEGSYTLRKFNESAILHKLTHQTIYATFWIVYPQQNNSELINWKELEHLALPVLLQNFVDKYKSQN